MDILQKQPDEVLVERYAKGENEAFDVLLRRHKNRIFSYIYFIVKDRELADDLFQETFVRVIMRIQDGSYAESGKFSSWVMRIAHNLIIDRFRQEKMQKTYSNDDEGTADMLCDARLCDATIEDRLVQDQVFRDVVSLVESLPPTQQDVIRMRFYDDLSFKEIAQKTNVSINTALGRVRYALQNMRKMAEEKGISLDFN